MAVTKVPTGAALTLKLNTGTDGSGNPVFRTKSLSNVKPAAVHIKNSPKVNASREFFQL
ncbi:MAG: DUF1659 domain-containing protein [Desulfotomaculaceae bacterium]|nr:DUF1659 domain-containing protein [Desulfotomaculaceae bacterium]